MKRKVYTGVSKLFKRFFNNYSPYNTSYTRIDDIIESGDIKRLEELGDLESKRSLQKIKIVKKPEGGS